MSQSRLVTIYHLTALWNRIKFDPGIDPQQVNALMRAVSALRTPVEVDHSRGAVSHHPLIEIKEVK